MSDKQEKTLAEDLRDETELLRRKHTYAANRGKTFTMEEAEALHRLMEGKK